MHLCQYSESAKIFPRHYTAGISVCQRVGIYEFKLLQQVVPSNILEALERKGELLVTDTLVICDLVSRLAPSLQDKEELLGKPYTYVLITKFKAR